MANTKASNDFDVIVVGAGFTGLYALQKLREQGLNVRVFEVGDAVGGTWYWNRYPGARTDSQSYVYQYWFSEELLNEWDWSERFPAQQETERYLNFVADKFDLRKDIQFGTRVISADYDEQTDQWTIGTDDGQQTRAQYFVLGSGLLTEIVLPDIPGIKEFQGESYHTARWPHETVDFSGKRVGVVGTGATGIQVIQTIAPEVGEMVVFQRTPNYTIPMNNPKFDEHKRQELRQRYTDIKAQIDESFAGFDFTFDGRSFYDFSAAERRARMEDLWAEGSLSFWVGSYREVFTDETANAEFSEFVREKIRARINDPALAEKLVPSGYGFGTRRVPLETNYYEAFNQDNVSLVDVRETPIEAITANGIKTAAGEIELDMLIFATGFDAGTGAVTRMDIRGREGQLLRDYWSDGPRSFMGLQVHGYPNLFTVMAPMSPAAAFCNVPTCIQQQVDWITDCIQFARDDNQAKIEPSKTAEEQWIQHHNEVADMTLVPNTDSWYMGSNIKGKKRTLLAYAGGADVYREFCNDVKAGGYKELGLS